MFSSWPLTAFAACVTTRVTRRARSRRVRDTGADGDSPPRAGPPVLASAAPDEVAARHALDRGRLRLVDEHRAVAEPVRIPPNRGRHLFDLARDHVMAHAE